MKKYQVLTIKECTNNNGETRFLVKVRNSEIITVETPLGKMVEESQTTYYLFLAEKPKMKVNATFEEDFNKEIYRIVTKDVDVTNEETGEIRKVQLKYVHLAR